MIAYTIGAQKGQHMADELWVFGYGSLIWNPDFAVAERHIARLHDWRRSFCMHSVHYRGTVSRPGLVLALDHAPGATCDGVAFLVQKGAEDETLTMLRTRELISSAYLEHYLTVELTDGACKHALAFVIDRNHAQYCGGQSLDAQAQVIAAAHGIRGPNRDYLFATAQHLAELGIEDSEMAQLTAMVRAL